MHIDSNSHTSAEGLRIGVAVSRYHEEITGALRDAAVRRFTEASGAPDDLEIVPAPGAYELVAICRALSRRGDLDALVALGCVISGETEHDRYIAQAVANGLSMITVETGMPIAFGVLTCRTAEQARARAGGARGNKGAEAMAAAIETARTLKGLCRGSRT